MSRVPPNRAAWCEVLEPAEAERVLLLSDEPETARSRLQLMGAAVDVNPPDDLPGPWNLVVAERPPSLEAVGRAWHRVAVGGRLAVVTDNARSPLRWLDRLRGSQGGPAIGSLPAVLSFLADAGAPHAQVFGLLRGSSSSPTVFRTDLPHVAAAVLGSSSANSSTPRRWAIGALARLAARGRSTAVVPAWLIVASDHRLVTGPLTPTGRIGVELNEHGAVVLGAGPDAIEKYYRDPAARWATLESLRLLEQVGFDRAPRIIDEPSPSRLRIEWVHGSDIDANHMPAAELETWLRRAGSVVGDLQRRTLRDDGTVRVHGDLWLGAMVADHSRIAAIIDWDDSHWGDPRTDMRSLVAVARDRPDLGRGDRSRLIASAYDGHAWAEGPEPARSQTEREDAPIDYLAVDRATWEAHEGRRPFAFTHSLADDPRLTHDAITALAARIPRASVEMNRTDLPVLFPGDDVPDLDLPPSELLERMVELRRWVALSNIETDRELQELIDECLDPIDEVIGDFQGGMTDREGYLFLAPPGSTTPAHLDFEHNFLLQIRGSKRVTVGFVDPDVEHRTLEEMTGGAYGRVPSLPTRTKEFVLHPGDGIYISPSLAHSVESLGDDLSISFSLVFHTPWLDRGSRVLSANHDLRRLGLDPAPYGSSSLGDHVKSGAVTVWRRLKSLVSR